MASDWWIRVGSCETNQRPFRIAPLGGAVLYGCNERDVPDSQTARAAGRQASWVNNLLVSTLRGGAYRIALARVILSNPAVTTILRSRCYDGLTATTHRCLEIIAPADFAVHVLSLSSTLYSSVSIATSCECSSS